MKVYVIGEGAYYEDAFNIIGIYSNRVKAFKKIERLFKKEEKEREVKEARKLGLAKGKVLTWEIGGSYYELREFELKKG